MADIQTVSIAVASTGVFVAAIYYIFQIRHQAKLRQTDMVMRLYSTLGTKEFHDALVEVYALQYKNYEDF